MTGPPVLLGLRALGLGDLCCAVPAWKALRRHLPDHRTVLAAPAAQRPVLELCPWLDDLDPVEGLDGPGPSIRGADLAVNLHGRGPQSTRLLAGTAPRRLLAFSGAPDGDEVGPPWRDDEHEVARWCRLVRHLGAQPDEDDLALERPRRAAAVPHATVVHPGAASGSRRWPSERWARVVAALVADGHRIVLTGTADEAARSTAIRERAGLPPDADRTGRTDLLDLAALVADARLVVSGDTGPAHLASAYRTPSVVLFGPTSPATWGPPATGPHRALWHGRTGDPHGTDVDPGLLAITVDEVLGAVDGLLASSAAP